MKEGKSMRFLPTGDQMKVADRYTIETIGMPSMVLMERAALQTVEVIEREKLDLSRVLVVCGPGNNGGDGYAVARLLHMRNISVDIYFAGNEESRSEDNKKQKEICEYYHIPTVSSVTDKQYSVIVDAVFGIGLKRKITGSYYTLIETLNKLSGTKVSIDVPTGLCDSTGEPMGIAFCADITVAIAFAKRGLVLPSAEAYVGKVVAVDIGIPMSALKKDEVAFSFEKSDLHYSLPMRKMNSNKGTYGKVLMIVGSEGMSGAAYLSAKAAYASGCGLVQIYTPECNRIILQQLLPEAIITSYVEYNEFELQRLLNWADVVGIGCGIGTGNVAEELVYGTLRFGMCPCVVDADALNILAKHMEWLLYAKQKIVMTPHMKEMARLLECTVDEVKTEPFLRLTEFAERNAVVCALKDARTLVARKHTPIYVNLTGNASMAKAGSGDVLTGMIVGLIAQGTDTHSATCMGVYLHGLAGDIARAKKGKYSVLASDIIDAIGCAYKEVE